MKFLSYSVRAVVAGAMLAAPVLATAAGAASVPVSLTLSQVQPFAVASGTLTADDQVATIALDLDRPGTSRVSFETLSYAGGTLLSGAKVAGGGFDPIISVYDQNNVLIWFNDDNPLGLADKVTGLKSDSRLDLTLKSGLYTIAVSQFDNFPDYLLDPSAPGKGPNFTAPLGCSNGIFCGTGGSNRTGSYTVQVSAAPIPLPAGLPLLATGLAALGGLGLARRRAA